MECYELRVMFNPIVFAQGQKREQGGKWGKEKGKKLRSVYLASVPLDGAGAVTLKSRAHSEVGRNLTDIEYLQAEAIVKFLFKKLNSLR